VGTDSSEVPFVIKADPNYKMTQADYDEQFTFLSAVLNKFNEVQNGIKDIRALRTQINEFVGRQGKDCPKEIKDMAASITKELTAIEETLYQTKSKSGQDPLNFPIRINDKLSGVFDVANSGFNPPSKQSKEVFADLSKQADEQLNKLKKIVAEDVPKFNQLIREKSLPVIGVK
jgi:ABC-type transporter Mla subunit MlaD